MSGRDELVPPAAVLPFSAQHLCEVSGAVLGAWAVVTLTTSAAAANSLLLLISNVGYNLNPAG